MSELNVKFVRWKLLPDMARADIPDGLGFAGLIEWVEQFELQQESENKQGALAFFRSLDSLGLKQIAASWAVPLKWRIADAIAVPTGRELPIEPSRVDDYGRLLAAQLVVLHRHGVHPFGIELLNEPVGKLRPQQYGELVKSFRKWWGRTGLPVIPLAGPGAVHTWDNRVFLRAVADAGEQLDIVSTHAWDGNTTRQLASLNALAASIPPGWNRPVFVTEYGIDQDRWYRPPYLAGPRSRASKHNAVEDVPFGVATAAQTLALLGSGANAVLEWEAQDPPWSDKNWGLLSRDDRRRPAVDALRTILRPLQIGDGIVSSGPRDGALPMALFARPTEMVLEIANPTPERQDYDISFRNCTVGPISVARSEAWPKGRTVEVTPTQNIGLRITIPGDTVASFTTSR